MPRPKNSIRSVLAQARLFPDMHPLTRQVQIACDTAKGAAARLAGIEIPKHEDNEVTLAELKQRIAQDRWISCKSVNAGQFEGAESRADRDQDSEPHAQLHGAQLRERFRAAEFLFSREHRLCDCCAITASRSARAISWAPSVALGAASRHGQDNSSTSISMRMNRFSSVRASCVKRSFKGPSRR